MGNVCISDNSTAEQRTLSKSIDRDLNDLSREAKQETKLLLLGPGESGKSTILKQFRIIYTTGFSEDELMSYKPTIHSNIITSMSALVRSLKADQRVLLSEENQQYCEFFDSPELPTRTEITEEIAQAVKGLWSDNIVKERFASKSNLQIIDSAEYFFDNIDRISNPNYEPEVQDVLYSRVRTTGITEIRFKLGGNPISLVDVGGQRSERRKWIHCFEGVTAIFFIVALSEYDQTLREDQSINRMEESLNLFSEIVNYSCFNLTSIILFLNKVDLLETKIQRVNLSNFYPDYIGGADVEQAKIFFRQQFEQRAAAKKRKIYTHYTTAVQTENIRHVFDDVEHIFMSKTIEEGFLI